MSRNWFEVDKAGLAKLIDGKGKVFLLHELVSNAWDTDSTKVEVTLAKVPGAPRARLVVKDDHPEGFKNLSHAYTLFAESEKKGEAEKRGRFNLGEKLVLALCIEAKITTTTGTVSFDGDGRRSGKERTTEGSVFEATVRMTQEEYDEVLREFRKVLPPSKCQTLFQNDVLPVRQPIATLTATLPTVLGDGEGTLRRTQRKTTVEVFEVLPGETAAIYEMGIPVVETGDKYHVNVGQKVPLTMERDNVPPAYLKLVRALVVNEVHDKLTEDDAKSVWVTQALGSEAIKTDAVKAVITTRFGEDVVTYDPSDRESNHKAAAHDYQVVHGGALPKEAWENVRKAGAIKPAGQVFPTYDGFASARTVDRDDLTPGMLRVERLTIDLGRELLGVTVDVSFIVSEDATIIADYRRVSDTAGSLRFNIAKFDGYSNWKATKAGSLAIVPGFQIESHFVELVDLIIHELGHHTEASHLSAAYHKAITLLAGRVAKLALTKPELFR